MGAHGRNLRRINFENSFINIGPDGLDGDDTRSAHQTLNIHAQHIIVDAALADRALGADISAIDLFSEFAHGGGFCRADRHQLFLSSVAAGLN